MSSSRLSSKKLRPEHVKLLKKYTRLFKQGKIASTVTILMGRYKPYYVIKFNGNIWLNRTICAKLYKRTNKKQKTTSKYLGQICA